MPKEWVRGCLRSRGGQEVPAVKPASRLLPYSEVGEHVLVCWMCPWFPLGVGGDCDLMSLQSVLLLWEFIRQHSMVSMSVVSLPGAGAVQFLFRSSSSHHHPLMASVSLLLCPPHCLKCGYVGLARPGPAATAFSSCSSPDASAPKGPHSDFHSNLYFCSRRMPKAC